MRRTVTVFDIDLPPGVAFVRSLVRAGVPVAPYSIDRRAAGRYSRYAGTVGDCPSVRCTDEFITWLADRLTDGSIDLVAPTSDYVAFAMATAIEKVGVAAATLGQPEPDAVRTALFKDRFHAAMARVGFPTPTSMTPATVDEAHAAAAELGYPVLLKPRTHAGIGLRRGSVVGSPDALAAAFDGYPLDSGHTAVLAEDPDVALPIVQRYYELGTVDVVSLTGYLRADGSVAALSHSRKVSQSPRRLGVGTMFEPMPTQPYTEAAVEAVRQVLGTGIFELEVLVDRTTREYVAVDLNPRGFGQMSLDIGRGNDLPVLWYNDVTGATVTSAPTRRRRPELWHDALGSYVGFAVRFARGPRRSAIARHAWGRVAAPCVGAMYDPRDPLPGIRFGLDHLRHPRAFVRPFLIDTELTGAEAMTPHVLEDPGHGGAA